MHRHSSLSPFYRLPLVWSVLFVLTNTAFSAYPPSTSTATDEPARPSTPRIRVVRVSEATSSPEREQPAHSMGPLSRLRATVQSSFETWMTTSVTSDAAEYSDAPAPQPAKASAVRPPALLQLPIASKAGIPNSVKSSPVSAPGLPSIALHRASQAAIKELPHYSPGTSVRGDYSMSRVDSIFEWSGDSDSEGRPCSEELAEMIGWVTDRQGVVPSDDRRRIGTDFYYELKRRTVALKVKKAATEAATTTVGSFTSNMRSEGSFVNDDSESSPDKPLFSVYLSNMKTPKKAPYDAYEDYKYVNEDFIVSHMNTEELLDQRFKLVKRLGQGGCGVVYKAIDRKGTNVRRRRSGSGFDDEEESEAEADRPEREVALKVANLLDIEQVDSVLREIAHHVRVSEMNEVTSVHEAIVLPMGFVVIVMDYVAGQDMFDYLTGDDESVTLGVPPVEVLKSVEQMANIIARLHSRNLAHGDIKPENFVRNKDGLIKVIDFGSSVDFSENSRLGYALDESRIFSEVYGSPSLLALLGKIRANHRSRLPTESAEVVQSLTAADWWALGAFLLRMTSGREDLLEDLAAARTPRAFNDALDDAHVDPEYWPYLLALLQYHDEDRLDSVYEVFNLGPAPVFD